MPGLGAPSYQSEQGRLPMLLLHWDHTMATDPKEHPLHRMPYNLPRPPGELPPGTEPPEHPNQALDPKAPDTAP